MLIYPLLLLFASQYPQLLAPVGLGVFMSLFALVPAFYFSVGQHVLRRRWLRALPLIVLMTMIASGMAVNTVRAIFQILQKRLIPFERTPKFGITRRDQSWRGNRYHIDVEPLIVYEILLGVFNLFTAWYAFHLGYYLMTMYAFIFALGLFYCSGLTIVQSISARFARDPEPASV